MVPLSWSVLLGVVLFVIGAGGVLLRRNILVVLMSLELLLNSVNINFIAFGRHYDDFRGQIFAIFVIAITAAELLVGNNYQQTILFTAANMLEIVVAVVLARRFGGGLSLATMDSVRRFLLTTVVFAPIPAAALAAWNAEMPGWISTPTRRAASLTWRWSSASISSKTREAIA